MSDFELEFLDEKKPDYEREHAFCAYWRHYLDKKGFLSRTDLVEMLQYSGWRDAIGDIIKRLCVDNLLATEDIDWLIDTLPEDTFARDQVQSLKMLANNDLSWEEKLVCAFDLHANWAAQKILSDISPAHVSRARQIVKERKAPKWLLQALPVVSSDNDI